jgi:hypothetical protein
MTAHEVSDALEFLKSRGHDVGQTHLPPPDVGSALRVWIDGTSRSFPEVMELAEKEGLGQMKKWRAQADRVTKYVKFVCPNCEVTFDEAKQLHLIRFHIKDAGTLLTKASPDWSVAEMEAWTDKFLADAIQTSTGNLIRAPRPLEFPEMFQFSVQCKNSKCSKVFGIDSGPHFYESQAQLEEAIESVEPSAITCPVCNSTATYKAEDVRANPLES